MQPNSRGRRRWAVAGGWRLLVLAVAGVLVLVVAIRATSHSRGPDVIEGPYKWLLASSSDLGPSHSSDAQLTVTLPDVGRPETLFGWARAHQLSVRWKDGRPWAIVEGAAQDLAGAFGVPVHDYRGQQGQVFYASPQQPRIPDQLHDAVTGIGRIMGFTPHRMARPDFIPTDVPKNGLSPTALLEAYNVSPLAAAGFRGKGITIVFFAFDGYDQKDLDTFADTSGLPRFIPTLVGGQPGESHGETVMDLEVAHAIAPDAHKVVVNARPTVQGDGGYEKIGQLFESVDQQFPGAVWSLSIGWGCEKLLRPADLAPAETALAAAQRNGTTAFDASGDTAGLECKGGDQWSAPPGPDDIGLDAIASLPTMTSVGGTTLSTDLQGRWIAEHAWIDSPLSQGSSGGVSTLFDRPEWQDQLAVDRDTDNRRLSPDIAAVADPFTGVRIIFDQKELIGAGTSQSAPIWAGVAAVMNQWLLANGGRPLGDLNPLLYQIAEGATRPGFRDVTLGANAVDSATPGYDLVTGLGSPNVDNLVRDLLDLQMGRAPR